LQETASSEFVFSSSVPRDSSLHEQESPSTGAETKCYTEEQKKKKKKKKKKIEDIEKLLFLPPNPVSLFEYMYF